MQILSVVWQEYKYDWSEHMARDERFHPAIMVSVSICILKAPICFHQQHYQITYRIDYDIVCYFQGTILIIFLACQSFLISSMEGLSYFDAFYACFITYMTIGFGDMDIFVSRVLIWTKILISIWYLKNSNQLIWFFLQSMSYRSSWLNMLLFGNFIHIVGYMILAAWISSCLDKFGVRKF